MKLHRIFLAAALACSMTLTGLAQPSATGRHEPAIHFIEVQPGVKLEVLDWWGEGRALVLLHGAGCTAHIFEPFAPRFAPRHRVIAITRRGAGASAMPASGYSDERFGQDVLAVVDQLRLPRPVLVGHSMAGAEMSWLNAHARARFSGFLYLDALGPTAFYSESSNDPGYLPFALTAMRARLDRLVPGSGELHPKKIAEEAIAEMPALQQQLQRWLAAVRDFPEPTEQDLRSAPPYLRELALNLHRYPSLTGPILATVPVAPGTPATPAPRTRIPEKRTLSQIDAFAYAVPSARVVRLPGATHFVFQSNEAEVVAAMEAFLVSLE